MHFLTRFKLQLMLCNCFEKLCNCFENIYSRVFSHYFLGFKILEDGESGCFGDDSSLFARTQKTGADTSR